MRVPTTPEELAALEARYRPFEPASAWSEMGCDAVRWARHADALREQVSRADPDRWEDLRERFMRAVALESAGLGELIRPMPDVTTIVLRSSVSDEAWTSAVDATRLVIECNRRALVVAGDAAVAGRMIDASLIVMLYGLVVEAQETFTVSDEYGNRLDVELPKRQYKPVSNYVLKKGSEVIPFAPASRVPAEMDRLTAEFASPAFAGLHPAIQSAYAHYALIHIHPFADGNGRLARTVASIPFLRHFGLPQVMLADQWPAYRDALWSVDGRDVRPLIELFMAAQVNAMDLARRLLASDPAELGAGAWPVAAGHDSPERMLRDLVQVHLRDRLGIPEEGWRYAVTRRGERVAAAMTHGTETHDVDFEVAPDGDNPEWLRVVASSGDVLEVWHDDVFPAPTEIVHLRVDAWLDNVLRQPAATSARVRGLFVLGVPRSGTTLMGHYIGSHPSVLDLAEYGGFYIAHTVAPAYVNRLPGREHAGFLDELRSLAVEHATHAAREQGCTWFCDATPWNLQNAGVLAATLPDSVYVLMLRHFAGCVLSLRQFSWAGDSWAAAARLWSTLNNLVTQLPDDRTLVVGYDEFAAHPAETISALREALASLDLDPARFDEAKLAISHAALVGRPRPTVGARDGGRTVLAPIASVDLERWTPEVHAEVWPEVREVHRGLRERFPEVYVAPPRPDHVPRDEW